ncbi:MAG: T9SS type A sorting domain-containing protein [Bacteroidetes bacterium]|nr:T9SS type A sorting domain-containing protein [Bacteroidota bacterium]
MQILRQLTCIIILIIAGASGLFAQSNPATAWDLSTGNYSLIAYPATSAAGTYPPNMVFHVSNTADPGLTTATTGDWTAVYNLTSGSRINGLDDQGIAMGNTSSGTNGFTGAAVLSLNSTGRANIQVSFTCQLLAQGDGNPTPRTSAFRLQYRTSIAAAWGDVPGPIEFSSEGLAVNTSQTLSVTLPVDANNQSLVQVRWKFYQIAQNSGGQRPRMRLDDISVTSASSLGTPSKFTVTGITPTSPSATSSFSAIISSVDGSNSPANVSTATNFSITLGAGTGTLSGTLTGTIPANNSSAIITGIRYNKNESGVLITATRTSGDVLTAGTSAPFTVGIGATQAVFNSLQTAGNANKNFRPFTVEARRPDASVDASFQGTVTLAKVSGAGNLGGTLTKSFVNGVATFSDINFSASGSYVISATSTDLALIQSSAIQVYGQLAMTELLVPKFMKSSSNTTRLPTFALVKFDNLIPNTSYRYFTGAVTGPTQPNTIGGGVDIHYNANTQTFVSNSNRNLTSTSTDYSTFTTAAGQTSMTIWVNMLPSANTTFSEGASVTWRIIMTDQPGFPADTFNTISTTKTLEFGEFVANGTGIFDSQSGLAAKTYICLYDNTGGTGNPISTALVQDEGATVAAGTTVPYYANLENTNGAWSTIIPNNLTTGVRRIEQRSLTTGAIIKFWSDDDGIWAGVNTVSQTLGATAIDFKTPQITLLSPLGGEQYCTNIANPIRWSSRGVQSMMIEYARGASAFSLVAANANGFAQLYNWLMTDITDSTTQLVIRLTDAEHPTETVTSAKVSAYTPPIIEIQPLSQNTCINDTVYLTVKAYGNIFKYQWQKEGFDIPGENSRTIALRKVTVTNSGTYTCNVIGYGPCGVTTSSVATVFITPPIQIVKQPENKTIALGATGKITVDVIGTNNHKFQWYRGSVPVQNSTRISGAQEATLVIRNFQVSDAGSNYYCTITGTAICGSATTRTLTLNQGILTANQDTVIACVGNSQQVRSLEFVQPIGTQLFYKWMRNGLPLSDGVKYSGTNTATLTIKNIEKQDQGFYAINVTAPSISGDVTMNHLVRVAPALRIKNYTSDIEICASKVYELSVEVEDTTGVQYQWLDNGKVAINDKGSIVERFIAPSDTNNYVITHKAIVSTVCGKDTVTMHARLITKPQILAKPKAIDTVKTGGIIYLGISATGLHPLNYRWKKDGKIIDGEFSPLYNRNNITKADSGTYQCLVMNGCDTTVITVRVVVIASTDVNEFTSSGYELEQTIPNPASTVVSVRYTLPEDNTATLSLVDMLGRTIWSNSSMTTAGQHSVSIDVSDFPTGVYFYTLSTPRAKLTKRLEVVR